jgi:hypothetical protein
MRSARSGGGSTGATPVAHPYQSCRDAECERPYCLIWREARTEGYRDGFADGFAAGAATAEG